MTVPPRTPEQREQALERALIVRRERAALRAHIRDGSVAASQVVTGSAHNPQWAALPVSWLLKAVPGVGPVRAERIMARIAISPSRRIQGLSERQRSQLLAELDRR